MLRGGHPRACGLEYIVENNYSKALNYCHFMSFFLFHFRHAPTLFSKDMEIQLMTIYEEVWVRASGSTLRSAEKYALVAEKNEPSRKKGRMEGGDT